MTKRFKWVKEYLENARKGLVFSVGEDQTYERIAVEVLPDAMALSEAVDKYKAEKTQRYLSCEEEFRTEMIEANEQFKGNFKQ
jgi:hypothetical protein